MLCWIREETDSFDDMVKFAYSMVRSWPFCFLGYATPEKSIGRWLDTPLNESAWGSILTHISQWLAYSRTKITANQFAHSEQSNLCSINFDLKATDMKGKGIPLWEFLFQSMLWIALDDFFASEFRFISHKPCSFRYKAKNEEALKPHCKVIALPQYHNIGHNLLIVLCSKMLTELPLGKE